LTAANNGFSAVLTSTPFDAVAGLTANQRAIGRGLEQGYGAAWSRDMARPLQPASERVFTRPC
jgi:hypothetical protein